MRLVIRYQSQLLFRKSYKPTRFTRGRTRTKGLTFRPARAGPIERQV
jgi:hypothetical protein